MGPLACAVARGSNSEHLLGRVRSLARQSSHDARANESGISDTTRVNGGGAATTRSSIRVRHGGRSVSDRVGPAIAGQRVSFVIVGSLRAVVESTHCGSPRGTSHHHCIGARGVFAWVGMRLAVDDSTPLVGASTLARCRDWETAATATPRRCPHTDVCIHSK